MASVNIANHEISNVKQMMYLRGAKQPLSAKDETPNGLVLII